MFAYLLPILITVTTLAASSINIAAAANLSTTLKSLKAHFLQRYPDTKLRLTVGSSGRLALQIAQGARYDIFLSADTTYPKRLYEANKALYAPKIYALGSLILLTRKRYDLDRGLALLSDKALKRVVIANPKTAPYGKAALEVLQNTKLYKSVAPKIIYAESISQALAYTLKAADAGIVAKSALYTPFGAHLKTIYWIDIPQRLHSPIAQAALLLKSAKDNEAAKRFYEYLFSQEAKEILASHGYRLP